MKQILQHYSRETSVSEEKVLRFLDKGIHLDYFWYECRQLTEKHLLASLACSPDGPGLEVSVLEDPGKESFGFGKLTLVLKRVAHSNFEELAVLACSLSRVLLRGEGLEADLERRALVWSFPCLTRAPCVVALLEPVVEEEEEEAEEEESVTLLHPALAEAADLDASLVAFAVLPSVQLGRGPAALLRPGRESDFFRFWSGEAPTATLFLLWLLPVDVEDSDATGLFLVLAGPFLASEELFLGVGRDDLGFLAEVGPKTLISSGASPRLSPRVPSLFDWWPGRSCSDVPAASWSSCSTNEATDRVRPLLLGIKRNQEIRF